MFKGSAKDQWGPEGMLLTKQAHDFFEEINSLVENQSEPSLAMVAHLIPTWEKLDEDRMRYRGKWVEAAKVDAKNGGSFTMLFGAMTNLVQCGLNLWASYVLDCKSPGNEASTRGLQVYSKLAENNWMNALGVANAGFKMSRKNAETWFFGMIPFFTSDPLITEISAQAAGVAGIPEEWFPSFS